MAGLVQRAPTSPVQGKCPARAFFRYAALAARGARQRGAIHAFLLLASKTWMPATSAGMT